MAADLDKVLDDFEQGRIDRRQLLTRLALATGGALLGGVGIAEAQSEKVVMPARSINHVHIDVSDLQRSADFYAAVFGAKMKSKSKTVWTMTFPDTTRERASWISLSTTGKPGTYNHVGIGVDLPTVKSTSELAAEMSKRFPFSKPRPTGPSDDTGVNLGARTLFITDPDGLSMQVGAPNDDGWLVKCSAGVKGMENSCS